MIACLNKTKKIIISILIFLLIGSYFVWKKLKDKANDNRYFLTKVQRGNIVVSVSGSGQIKSQEEIDLKAKVSGEISEILVKEGQEIKKGELLFKIDPKNYEKALENAKIAKDTAKQNLETLTQNKNTAEKDLAKAYNDAFSAISDIFSNLSLSFSNLEPFFTQSSYSGDESDIDYYCGVVAFYSHYQKASKEKEEQFLHFKEKYQNLRKDFLLISNKTERATLEQWLNLTLNFTQEFADFLREVRDQISFYKRIVKEENLKIPISENITDSQYNTLQNLVSLLDQKISTIHTLSKTIDQLKNSISNLENEIKIQTDTLGQKEKDLQDAKENYENCFIKSPISGIVSKVQVKIGDNISQGTVLASLISKEKIVEISLNEIDAAKVKPGQKETLTF
ncbi:biotin/lipoyl-binding protein, partial [Candidatus Parcubacteria bacterium]|nr:biotin/lipoyl-binding protein [Candidatus Parcubacteria bacterium]